MQPKKIKCIHCKKEDCADDKSVRWAIRCSKLNIGVHLQCAVQNALDNFMKLLFIKNFFKNNAVRMVK